jgi:hypothetical protein
VIATRGDEIVFHLPLPTITFRYTDEADGDPDADISDLRDLAKEMADYLVVPVWCRDWVLRQPSLARHIELSYRLVTDQRNVCSIYDLHPTTVQRR